MNIRESQREVQRRTSPRRILFESYRKTRLQIRGCERRKVFPIRPVANCQRLFHLRQLCNKQWQSVQSVMR
jgi:hypothetical protein